MDLNKLLFKEIDRIGGFMPENEYFNYVIALPVMVGVGLCVLVLLWIASYFVRWKNEG